MFANPGLANHARWEDTSAGSIHLRGVLQWVSMRSVPSVPGFYFPADIGQISAQAG